jgi:hydrogenase expression/formation protein HypC
MCLAIPGRIIEVEHAGEHRMARIDFGGVIREAFLDFVPEAKIGDYVLVHVGFAIVRLDEQEAQRTLEYLRQLDPAGGATTDSS